MASCWRLHSRNAPRWGVCWHRPTSTDLLSKTLNGNRNMKADEFVNLCQVLDLTLEDFKAPQSTAE